MGDTADRATFTPIGSATSWTSLRSGFQSSCGVRADGSLYCWGGNDFGQLGTSAGAKPTPTLVGPGFRDVDVGNLMALALRRPTP